MHSRVQEARRLDGAGRHSGMRVRPRRTRGGSPDDENAIALLGEFNSGASAISIPITNEAGILQVSPSNTALELTKDAGPGRQGRPREVLPDGRAHLRARRARRPHPGLGPGRVDGRGGRQEAVRPRRQAGVRRGRRQDHRRCRRAERHRGRRKRTASTRRRRTTGRSRPRSRTPAPTRCSSAASPPTTRSSCTRTSVRRCRTRRCGVRTAWPSPTFTNDLPGGRRGAHVHHGRDDQPEGLRAQGPEVLRGLQGAVQAEGHPAVRDLRLRGDGRRSSTRWTAPATSATTGRP